MEGYEITLFHIAVVFLLFWIVKVLLEIREELKKGGGWYTHIIHKAHRKEREQKS